MLFRSTPPKKAYLMKKPSFHDTSVASQYAPSLNQRCWLPFSAIAPFTITRIVHYHKYKLRKHIVVSWYSSDCCVQLISLPLLPSRQSLSTSLKDGGYFWIFPPQRPQDISRAESAFHEGTAFLSCNLLQFTQSRLLPGGSCSAGTEGERERE